MAKLTNTNYNKIKSSLLTTNIDAPFILGFKYKLYNGFTFKEMKPENYQSLQLFLNKIAGQSVSYVDKKFARKPDKNDEAYGKNIRHYSVSDKFRIHVILEDGVFFVLRLDTKHKVHKD